MVCPRPASGPRPAAPTWPLRLALLPGPRLPPRRPRWPRRRFLGHLLRGEQRQDCTRENPAPQEAQRSDASLPPARSQAWAAEVGGGLRGLGRRRGWPVSTARRLLLTPRWLRGVRSVPRCRDCALGLTSSLGTPPSPAASSRGVASVRPSALSPVLPALLPVLQLLWPLPCLAPRTPQEAMPSACVQLPPHRNPQTALMPPRLSILAAAPPASHFCPRWTLGVDLDTLPIALHTRHLREPRSPAPLCCHLLAVPVRTAEPPPAPRAAAPRPLTRL